MMRKDMTVANVSTFFYDHDSERDKKVDSLLSILKWWQPCSCSSSRLDSLPEKPLRERPTAFVHFYLFFSQDLVSGLIEKSFCLFLSMIGNKNSSLESLLNCINQEG